jgi:hypothetical protein
MDALKVGTTRLDQNIIGGPGDGIKNETFTSTKPKPSAERTWQIRTVSGEI